MAYLAIFSRKMGSYVGVVFLVLFVIHAQAAPLKIDDATHSRRDLQQILKKAAETAESIGKQALKYVIPDTEQPGVAVLKPFLKKRGIKRSVAAPQPPMTYNWPYYNQMNFQRSAIPYPGNTYASYDTNYWNSKPYLNSPYQRSTIPYAPNYYQQPQQMNSEKKTLNSNEANSVTDMKNSLEDFQKLISNVDTALVSFSDKTGVALSENLKGVDSGAKKRGKIDGQKKRSKMSKKKAKDELKKITDTFTDFICGDSC